MKKKLLLLAFVLSGILTGISAQEYYIEGFYQRHKEGVYTLRDIFTQGITLNGKEGSIPGVLNGSKEEIICNSVDATMIQFSFARAETTCPTKWEKGFIFQYWDEDNNKWKTDVESCRNDKRSVIYNDMVIMLVLDYSGSMRENISKLQACAINFINTVSKASNGNVHVGIIAFAGMEKAKTQVFPITPITNDNRYKFEQFIRNARKGSETALYFSMHKAINMMEKYVNETDIPTEKYKGSYIITFTDGLDNASINDDIAPSMHRGSKNEYLGFLSALLSGSSRKEILNTPVESYAIGFTGSEDFTNEDMTLFENVLQKTTPDESHFKLASNFDEVERFFEYITSKLTETWETINMYVGESQYGRIRWVLDCGSARKIVNKTVSGTTRNAWFGISAELGTYNDFLAGGPNVWYGNEKATASHFSGFYGGLNLDMAFSFNQTLALGGRVGIFACGDSYDLNYFLNNTFHSDRQTSTSFGFLIGPELKITLPKDDAFILGVGSGLINECFTLNARLGYKFRTPWYITAELLYSVEDDAYGAGIGFGYSFGGKLRNK